MNKFGGVALGTPVRQQQQFAAFTGQSIPGNPTEGLAAAQSIEAMNEGQESGITRKARERVAESTNPR